MNVVLWNSGNKKSEDKKIWESEVKSFSHFHVVRDYVITLENGLKVELSADLIKEIVNHELKEVN
jgi:hypothetical protein